MATSAQVMSAPAARAIRPCLTAQPAQAEPVKAGNAKVVAAIAMVEPTNLRTLGLRVTQVAGIKVTRL
jgi:hypothetical protein